jgi:hypothetical protein
MKTKPHRFSTVELTAQWRPAGSRWAWETIKPSDICEHCGEMRMKHYVANYSDGQLVAGAVYICPRNVFKRVPTPPQEGE